MRIGATLKTEKQTSGKIIFTLAYSHVFHSNDQYREYVEARRGYLLGNKHREEKTEQTQKERDETLNR